MSVLMCRLVCSFVDKYATKQLGLLAEGLYVRRDFKMLDSRPPIDLARF